MKIPKSWDDVTVSQYIAVSSVDFSTPLKALPEIFEALRLDSSEVLNMSLSEATSLTKTMDFLFKLPEVVPTEKLGAYMLRDFSLLRFDEFIDLDTLITKGCLDNLHQIAAILYSDSQTYDFQVRKKRAVEVLSLPFSSVWPCVRDFLGYRTSLLKQYKGLFRMNDSENDPFYDEEYEKNQQPDPFAQKWGWYGYLNTLAGDDITKHREIFALGHIDCLNQLAFFLERREHEKANKKDI